MCNVSLFWDLGFFLDLRDVFHVSAKLELNGCIVWNAHNTVFGLKRSAVCAQAVYFLHSTRPSVT